MTLPVYGFMHVACMNHWRDVVGRQIWKIKEGGLLERTSKIFWGALGDPDNLLFDPAFMSKVEVGFRSPDLGLFEYPTLALLEEVCRREDCIVWYIHTKGVSASPPDPGRENLRDYMEYFVIENWQSCLSAIDAGADATGTIWVRGHRMFLGNFWWASSAHIRRLKRIEGLDRTNRLLAETWIGQIAQIRKPLDNVIGAHDLWPFDQNPNIPREKYPRPEQFHQLCYRE